MHKCYRVCDISPEYQKVLRGLIALGRDVRFIGAHDGYHFNPSLIVDVTSCGSTVGLVGVNSVRFRRWKEKDAGLMNWARIVPDTPNFDKACVNSKIHPCHLAIGMNFMYMDVKGRTFLIRSKFDDAHYIASVEYNSMIKLQNPLTFEYDHHICDSEFNTSNFDFIAERN